MKSPIFFALLLSFISSYTKAQISTQELHRQAIELAKISKFTESLPLFDKAIELDPKNPSLWYDRGTTHFNTKEYHKALSDYEKTVELNPNEPRYYLTIARIKKLLIDFDGALAVFDKCIDKNPDFAPAHFQRGILKEQLGNIADACVDYNKAKLLGYKNAEKHVEECGTQKAENVRALIKLNQISNDSNYGFDEKKPIKVGKGIEGMAANQYSYLNLLRDAQNKPIVYKRLGSCCPHESKFGLINNTAMLDKYEITYLDENNKSKTATVYITLYDYENPLILKGFKTVDFKNK